MHAGCTQGVWRSSRYAANLEGWYKHFPKAALHVVATEELELQPRATLDGITAFLGLPPSAAAAAAGAKRYCVIGKNGVMETAGGRHGWRAKRLGETGEGGDGAETGIGECSDGAETKATGADGVRRYQIDVDTADLLHRFFAPYNARLFGASSRPSPTTSSRPTPLPCLTRHHLRGRAS